ncbi:MAG: hypothetical protein RL021_1541 [Bacteroidota bacterium]
MIKMDNSSKDQFNQWHKDPYNWKWGMIYYNKKDPRVWLPKRNPVMGWTLNFAHRSAYIWLIGLMAIPLITMLLLSKAGK